MLVATIVLNFILIPPFGIAGLASAIAITSWLNCLMLYVILHRRGHFRIEGWLASRIIRQLIAGALMVAALYGIVHLIEGWGLWRAKAWASWLGYIAAALYLPFDLYAFATHRHWLEAVVVAINLLVVWVLARDLMVRRR